MRSNSRRHSTYWLTRTSARAVDVTVWLLIRRLLSISDSWQRFLTPPSAILISPAPAAENECHDYSQLPRWLRDRRDVSIAKGFLRGRSSVWLRLRGRRHCVQRAQAFGLAGVHTAVLGAPFVKAGVTKAMFATDFLDWHPYFGLPEKSNDLLFAVFAWFACPSFSKLMDFLEI